MKSHPFALALLAGILPVLAQEPATTKWDVEIPGPIADGEPTAPAPPPVVPDFSVIQSQTRRLDVVEAPPMSGLPPVQGTISVTTRKVENPELPELPVPLPVLPPDDPAVIARLEELREKYQGTTLLFLSATIYDNRRTFLRIYPNGKLDKVVSAWSNLDFNHFSGFSTYRVRDAVDGTLHDFGLLMGVGNTRTAAMQRFAEMAGREYEAPEIPELPDVGVSGPAFVVVQGDADSPAMDTLEQVHDLYRKEGVRMEAAYHARVETEAQRRAFLLANPPKPKDVVIHYWRGNRPENSSVEGGGR